MTVGEGGMLSHWSVKVTSVPSESACRMMLSSSMVFPLPSGPVMVSGVPVDVSHPRFFP